VSNPIKVQAEDSEGQSLASPDDSLAVVMRLYQHGQYMDAWEASKPLGTLTRWRSPEGRVLAGRLANNLGAPRLGGILHRLAHREFPNHPLCTFYGALAYWSAAGTVHAWRKYRHVDLPENTERSMQADWLAMKAAMLSVMRDFSRADQLMIQALEMQPESAWLHVELSEVLDRQDLHQDALQAAQDALRLHPWFRPAVQSAGQKLVQLGRDDEAIELLTKATVHIQSGHVWCQLGLLQVELKQYDAAWQSFVEAEKRWPMAGEDSAHRQWLAGQRSDIAYFRGDYPSSIAFAREVDRPFYRRLIEKLEHENAKGSGRRTRIQLPVPFIRQHHETCAPATLTALAQYWQREVRHEAVIERICYEGTQASDERRWAEENGFFAREFRLSEATAYQLIRAGVPFTLNTVEPGSAHLQAVIGIDELRGTILIQDPSERHVGEATLDKLLEHYASTGPRCMVMIPENQRVIIDQIELLDTDLYDWHHRVESELAQHRRERAVEAIEAMKRASGQHRLTLQSEMALARYDGDQASTLRLAEELLKQFPDDSNLQLVRLACLAELGKREQRLKILRECCRRASSQPLFLSRLASELMDDARNIEEANLYLKKALYLPQPDGKALGLYANVLWNCNQRDAALEFYRLAASLSEKDESYARTYFVAARYLHQTESVLDWLDDRVHRFGRRSSLPGRTLAWAYDQLEQSQRSLELLANTAIEHPDDGELRLHCAIAFGRHNQAAVAAEHLAAAQGKASQASYLRTAAALAHNHGRLNEARSLYSQVLQLEPLDIATHEQIVGLDLDLDGIDVAERRLRETVSKYPHSYSLRILLIQWLRSNHIEVVERELASFLADHPQDAWIHREIAIVALLNRDLIKASKFAELAVAADPNNDVTHYLLGRIAEQSGEIHKARDHFREAIRRNADHEAAISALIESCDRPKDRIEQLDFIYNQFQSQTIFGEGVLAFREAAVGNMDSEALLNRLELALRQRPDLWHCHTALIQQYMTMHRHEQAVMIAQQSTKRFPLLPRVWIDLALVYRNLGEDAAELEALLSARDINPNWPEVSRELAAAYLHRQQFDQAEQILRQLLIIEPREPQSLAFFADYLFRVGKKTEALESLKRACLLAPSFDGAWQTLSEWSREIDDGEFVRDSAQVLLERRPRDARSYLRYSQALDKVEELPRALEAIEKAIQLDPRSVDAYVHKAQTLGRLHRWEDALEACSPAIYQHHLPVALQIRRAHVLYHKGEIALAIDAMQRALEEDCDQYEAWSQLADWAEESSNLKAYARAASNLVRIDPHQAIPHGYLADSILRENGDRKKAIEHLEIALRLSPSYSYAALRLIDLYLEDHLADDARRVLAKGGEHLPAGYKTSLKLKIAACEAEQDENGYYVAVEALIRCCREDSVRDVPGQAAISRAVDTFVGDLMDDAIRRLSDEICLGHQLAPLGVALGRLLARSIDLNNTVEHLLKIPDGLAWQECVRVMLRSYPSFEREYLHLVRVKEQFGARIRNYDAAWAAMANTLLDYGQVDEVLRWTEDWRNRKKLCGTDLIPVVASNWEKFQLCDAREAANFALDQPHDASASMHHIWLGLDALIRSDFPSAVTHAQRANPGEIAGWYPMAYRILVSGCEAWPQSSHIGQGRSQLLMRQFSINQFATPEFQNDRLTKWIVAKVRANHAKARASYLQSFWFQIAAWFQKRK
jgi:cellulose synthase operon protein C